ncbi:hypothetical protein BGZ73_000240, partial [Actinomortierella ambigua]
ALTRADYIHRAETIHVLAFWRVLLATVQDALFLEDPAILHQIAKVLKLLYATRYLQPRVRIPFSTDLRFRVYEARDDSEWQRKFRITRPQFRTLVALIKDYSVFGYEDPSANCMSESS